MNAHTRVICNRPDVLAACTDDKRTKGSRNQHRECDALGQLNSELAFRLLHGRLGRALDDEFCLSGLAHRRCFNLDRAALLLHALKERAEAHELLI